MPDWIENSPKAIIAGILGSFALSLLDMLNQHFGLVPGMGPSLVLAKLLPMSWRYLFGLFHYLIGITWGFLFIFLNQFLQKYIILKGMLFGLCIWLILMSTLMPYIDAGLFCYKSGLKPAFFALACDICFGIIVSIIYNSRFLQSLIFRC
jgi:hypothetical protein